MHATYFDFVDPKQLRADHPIGDEFLSFAKNISRDALFAHQDRLFRKMLLLAWKTPFYQKLWGAKGIEPGDIDGLKDIHKLPTYDKSDIMASIERCPPFGDFSGLETYPPNAQPPVKFHTTSGTTGSPKSCSLVPSRAKFKTCFWPVSIRCRASAVATLFIPSMVMALSMAGIISARP